MQRYKVRTEHRVDWIEGAGVADAVDQGSQYGIVEIDEASRASGTIFEQVRFTVGTHSSRVAPIPSAIVVLSVDADGVLESAFDGERKTEKINSGILHFVPAGTAQEYDFKGTTTNIATTLHGDLLTAIRDRNPELRSASLDEPWRGFTSPRLARLVLEQNRLVRLGQMGWRSLADVGMVQLGVELMSLTANRALKTTAPLSAAEIAQADAYLRDHLDRNVPLAEIAELSGRDVSAFSRAWRDATGETFHRHAISLRLEEAQRRLGETEEPIAIIALETGFSSQAHMTATMRQHWNVTPAKLRKQLWG